MFFFKTCISRAPSVESDVAERAPVHVLRLAGHGDYAPEDQIRKTLLRAAAVVMIALRRVYVWVISSSRPSSSPSSRRYSFSHSSRRYSSRLDALILRA